MLLTPTRRAAAGWLLLVLQWHGGVVRGALYRPPRTYTLGEDIPLFVDALTSTFTQIPIDYYRLPFCQPEGGPMMEAQSTGQYLEGSRIQTSPFRVNMATEGYCRKLCQVTLSNLEFERIKWHVERGYRYNWMLDHLPAAHLGSWPKEKYFFLSSRIWIGLLGDQREQYANGFPIGANVLQLVMSPNGSYYQWDQWNLVLLNHFNLVIDYHRIEPIRKDQEARYRVVEFAVQPFSVHHRFDSNSSSWKTSCPNGKLHFKYSESHQPQKLAPDQPILFTYDVIWRESEKPWSKRWESYLAYDEWVVQIRWYSVTSSAVFLVYQTMLLVADWVRVTKPPSDRGYASLSEVMAAELRRLRQEDRNWCRLHGDVFRPPSTWPCLFCALIGTGVQLTVACSVVLILAALGVVGQDVPGSIPNAFLVVFNLSGVVSGYVSHRLCASFGGGPNQLKRVARMVALIVPACLCGSFLVLNAALAFRQSTASLSVTDLSILLAGWLCGLIPMVFLGAYFAGLQDVMEYPTHTDPVPRPIPVTCCCKKPLMNILMNGCILFVTLIGEFQFAMSCFWQRQYYYEFRVALVVYGMSLLTSGVQSALMVCGQLRRENHRWCWYSLFCGGSVGFAVACFLTWFLLDLDESFVTYLVYMTHMLWISVGTFLIFGSFSFFSALLFLLRLYSTLEPDQIEAEEAVNRNEDVSAGYIMLDSIAPTSSSEDVEDQGTTPSAHHAGFHRTDFLLRRRSGSRDNPFSKNK